MKHDLVFKHGRILDGCGSPWFYGDLGITDDQIVSIGPPGSLSGTRQIDVKGCYVAPGIIDVHTHSDLSLFINPQAESVVRQGVTTHIIGNCGSSPAPVTEAYREIICEFWGEDGKQPEVPWSWSGFGEYLDAIEKVQVAINIGSLAGHGGVRMAVMGLKARSPDPDEMQQMCGLVEEALDAGVFGLSTGLVYPPGCYADTQEIIDLCKVVARHKGLYTSHIRGERETIIEAVAEAIEIGKQAGIPVQVSHNAPKYGAAGDAHHNLGLIDQARAAGQDVTVDNDVHTDLGPLLISCLPQEIEDLPDPDIFRLLCDPEEKERIKAEILGDSRPAFGPSGLVRHQRWDRITMLHAPNTPDAVGKTIEKIASLWLVEPFEVFFELILQNGRKADAIFDYIEEENIRILLRHPNVMICSDGRITAPYGYLGQTESYEPCSYGEFPGVLERYVRDNPVLSLEEAIRKMTSFPAWRFGLWDRGILRPGFKADLFVFDLERVRDRATNLFPHTYPFENFPHHYPEGIDYVIVNGALTVEEGEHTGVRAGQVLRHRK